MNIQPSHNISFKARCPQLRDADWICRAVNNAFPHFSSTRRSGSYLEHYNRTDLFLKQPKPACKNEDLYRTLTQLILSTGDPRCTLWSRIKINFRQDLFSTKKQRKNYRILQAIQYNMMMLHYNRGIRRKNGKLSQSAMFDMMYRQKLGNCNELSNMIALALNLNGIKNVSKVGLYNKATEESVDHCFCMFNRDGSKVDFKNLKNAIVVDAWAGKVDFADNMLLYYKNMRKADLDITDATKLGYENEGSISGNIENFGLTEQEKKEILPKLIHNYSPKSSC